MRVVVANLLRNAVALLLGLLLALGVGEVAVRIVEGPPAWFLFSGSFRDRRIGFDVEYHVTDALRRVTCDPRGEAANGRPRIAVIGDSFVFGQGVPDCHDFVSLLDGRQDAVRFENFGVIGSSPLHYRLVARDMVDGSYDGALLVFYGNDFPRYGERSPFGVVADHSSLFALIRKAKRRYQVDDRMREIEKTRLDPSRVAVFNNVASMIQGPMPAYARRCVDPDAEEIAEFAAHFEAILAALERSVPREQIVVTMVPQGSVVSHGLRRFIAELGGELAPFGRRGAAYEAVERLATEHGLRFIDTFDEILAHGDEAYWHDDFHWNEIGHERMADLVARAYGLPTVAAADR